MPQLPIIHIVLSGGFGSRLWPLSRKNFPKPLLPIVNGKSLLELTVERHIPIINQSIFVTNEDQFFNLKECISSKSLDNTQFIVESCSKNTAPAISLAVHSIELDDAIFVVTPSDHLISPIENYQQFLQQAIEVATNESMIVLFGITPTSPSINYGYIEIETNINGVAAIQSFHEKPIQAKANEYIKNDHFFWNSGIFCFRKSSFINEMSSHCPELIQSTKNALKKKEWIGSNAIKIPYETMSEMQKISIDYALIEKTNQLKCIPTNFSWFDLGNFNELKHVFKEQDENFTQSEFKIVTENSKNNVIVSKTRPIVLNNVSDISIIDTEDVLYVSKTDENNSQSNGFNLIEDHLPQLQNQSAWEIRPWGRFDVLREEDGFKVKKIMVKPNGSLSLQYHHHRCEHWLVISGQATVQLNDETLSLNPGDSIDIPTKAHHRLQNFGTDELVIIETQFGDYLGEDDIVRINDVYNRN
ncbi:MAG: mannose-1-phosphate guanylyltransferase/mannose-6-phosphate isomerase [Candidatus Margulisiibacteriota bacterium]